MEGQLKQAFLYYDRDADGLLNLEDTLVVLRSANVAVDIDDVKFFMNAEYAEEGQMVTSVDWNACLRMAKCYCRQNVGRAKVKAALGTFAIDGKKNINVQELRHCLRSLAPPSIYVTGSDVATFALKDIDADANGATTEAAILKNF